MRLRKQDVGTHLNHQWFLTLARLEDLDQVVGADQARGRDESCLISESQRCERNCGGRKDDEEEQRAKVDKTSHRRSLRIINF